MASSPSARKVATGQSRGYGGQRARTNALAAFGQMTGRGPGAQNPRVRG